MISGPVVAQVLEGENAVAANRDIMGATDPKKAAAGTIRKDFAGIDRGEFGAWLRFGRKRRDRDRLLLRRDRNRPLIVPPLLAPACPGRILSMLKFMGF